MGRRIERLFHLPQSPFEKGTKTPLGVLARRMAGQPSIALYLPQIADRLFGSFLSPEIKSLRDSLISHPEASDPSLTLIRENIIFLPERIFLRASPFHLDMRLRDSFATWVGLNNPLIEKLLLDSFVKRRSSSGQIPTALLFASDRRWYFDDESTALALIWRAKLAQLGQPLGENERQIWTGILAWLQNHEESGSYVTPAGPEGNWLDTLIFPDEDVVSYNQGVHAVALMAAKTLGLLDDDRQIDRAIQAYNSLTHPSGRLQLSRRIPYRDVSCLFGEHLANSIFKRTILDRETVKKTIASFPREEYGYRVVSDENGNFLDSSKFTRLYPPGDYQNGATWPLFDCVVQAIAEYHHIGYRGERSGSLTRALYGLRRSQNAEYIKTGELAATCPEGPAYDPKRSHHAWNALCYLIARQVLGPQIYAEILRSTAPVPLASEVSQYQSF